MHDKHSNAPLKQIPAGVWILGKDFLRPSVPHGMNGT
jgi:hypothetical protein